MARNTRERDRERARSKATFSPHSRQMPIVAIGTGRSTFVPGPANNPSRRVLRPTRCQSSGSAKFPQVQATSKLAAPRPALSPQDVEEAQVRGPGGERHQAAPGGPGLDGQRDRQLPQPGVRRRRARDQAANSADHQARRQLRHPPEIQKVRLVFAPFFATFRQCFVGVRGEKSSVQVVRYLQENFFNVKKS